MALRTELIQRSHEVNTLQKSCETYRETIRGLKESVESLKDNVDVSLFLWLLLATFVLFRIFTGETEVHREESLCHGATRHYQPHAHRCAGRTAGFATATPTRPSRDAAVHPRQPAPQPRQQQTRHRRRGRDAVTAAAARPALRVCITVTW